MSEHYRPKSTRKYRDFIYKALKHLVARNGKVYTLGDVEEATQIPRKVLDDMYAMTPLLKEGNSVYGARASWAYNEISFLGDCERLWIDPGEVWAACTAHPRACLLDIGLPTDEFGRPLRERPSRKVSRGRKRGSKIAEKSSAEPQRQSSSDGLDPAHRETRYREPESRPSESSGGKPSFELLEDCPTLRPITLFGITVMAVQVKPFADEPDEVQGAVSVRSVCEALGIDRPTQMEKIREEGWMARWDTPLRHPRDGISRATAIIHIIDIPNWLNSINPNKVKEEIRGNIARIKAEITYVVRTYFSKGVAANPRFSEEEQNAELKRQQEKNRELQGELEHHRKLLAIKEEKELELAKQQTLRERQRVFDAETELLKTKFQEKLLEKVSGTDKRECVTDDPDLVKIQDENHKWRGCYLRVSSRRIYCTASFGSRYLECKEGGRVGPAYSAMAEKRAKLAVVEGSRERKDGTYYRTKASIAEEEKWTNPKFPESRFGTFARLARCRTYTVNNPNIAVRRNGQDTVDQVLFDVEDLESVEQAMVDWCEIGCPKCPVERLVTKNGTEFGAPYPDREDAKRILIGIEYLTYDDLEGVDVAVDALLDRYENKYPRLGRLREATVLKLHKT